MDEYSTRQKVLFVAVCIVIYSTHAIIMATGEITRQRRIDIPPTDWSVDILLVHAGVYYFAILLVFAPFFWAAWNSLLVPALRLRVIGYFDALKVLIFVLGMSILWSWDY